MAKEVYMTALDLTKQLYDLALDHTINGERFTKRQLEHSIHIWLRKDGDNFIFEITLPDGRWFAEMRRIGDEYDYYIPDTREQEQRVIDRLMAKSRRA